MIDTPSNANRGRLLATLRMQYPDALAERGFRLLHPVSGDPYTDHRRHLVATCRSIANFAIGAVAVYGIVIHMAVVYLATALKFSSDTLSAEEKDLAT